VGSPIHEMLEFIVIYLFPCAGYFAIGIFMDFFMLGVISFAAFQYGTNSGNFMAAIREVGQGVSSVPFVPCNCPCEACARPQYAYVADPNIIVILQSHSTQALLLYQPGMQAVGVQR
jgi:hypothetical protein